MSGRSSYDGLQNIKPDADFIKLFTESGRYCERLLKKDFDKKLQQYYNILIQINNILKPYHLHFGFRVIDEIMMYLTYGYEYEPDYVHIDLDLQILQKILPKLHGNRKQLELPLTKLLRFCFNVKYELEKPLTKEEKECLNVINFDEIIEKQYEAKESVVFKEPTSDLIQKDVAPIFPRAARKLSRMMNMLDRQGFASFIE